MSSKNLNRKADPIFAAIEAHRRGPPANIVDKGQSARLYIGEVDDVEVIYGKADKNGATEILIKPDGKKRRLFVSDRRQIKANVPRDLDADARLTWISERIAEFEKEERRVAKARARTKLGKLEAILDKAYERERDRMWDLIWTVPTTPVGLAALLKYCRENGSISQYVHEDIWEDALEWSIESAVCSIAGLPVPPMPKLVADEWKRGEQLAA